MELRDLCPSIRRGRLVFFPVGPDLNEWLSISRQSDHAENNNERLLLFWKCF